MIMSYVFTLFFPDLHDHIRMPFAFGIIQYVKGYGMSFALHLGDNTVFLFRFLLDTDVMLRNPAQHIPALSHIHDFFVNFDAVYSGVFVLIRKPLAFQPVIDILCIGGH